MSGFGDSENGNAGVISAVNMAALMPEPTTSTALMNLTYMQFFATWIGVFAGKLYGLDADANEFAHNYRTQFLNFGLNINEAATLAPVSAWGGGIVIIPMKSIKHAVIALCLGAMAGRWDRGAPEATKHRERNGDEQQSSSD